MLSVGDVIKSINGQPLACSIDDNPLQGAAAVLSEVRDGEVKGGTLLPCLYEFPEAMQKAEGKPWRDPKHWPMVLPNLGRSITVERLANLQAMAEKKGKEAAAGWATKHLNIQAGMGTHSGRWIGADLWPIAAGKFTLEELLTECDVVTVGIDGGGLDDLLGLGVIGRHRRTRNWHIWARAWAQTEVLDKRKEIAPRLKDFEADGDLVMVPADDPTADLRELAAICADIHARGLFPESYGIGLDPYGITALVDEMEQLGLSGDLLARVGQGTRLSPAVWGLERKLKDGTVRHAGQEMLTWCVSNAKSEQRGGATLISKAVAGKAKIDPLIGVFNAAMLMSRNPIAAGVGGSPWDDPDFSLSGGR